MTSIIQPRFQFESKWALGESGWKEGMDENLCKIDRLLHICVNGIGVPPTFANDGDQFIDTMNNVLTYVSGWRLDKPRAGMTAYNKATKLNLLYDGTGWIPAPSNISQQDLLATISGNAKSIFGVNIVNGVPVGPPQNSFPFSIDTSVSPPRTYIYNSATNTHYPVGTSTGGSGGAGVSSVNGETGDIIIPAGADAAQQLTNTQTLSALTQTIALAEFSSNRGQPNGYASLDSNGLVPSSQLPDSTPPPFMGFMARQSSNIVHIAGNFEEHIMDNVKYDTFGSAYNPTTGRFTVPKTGFYDLRFIIQIQHEEFDGSGGSPSEPAISAFLRRRSVTGSTQRNMIAVDRISPEATFNNQATSTETLKVVIQDVLNISEEISIETLFTRNGGGSGTIRYTSIGASSGGVNIETATHFSARFLGE